MVNKLASSIRKHYIAIIIAFFVGIICIAPQLFFIHSLGNEYQGIHMMATDNEDIYLARMHEITEGHTLIGSLYFWEYKNALPLMPPTAELFLVILSKIFFLSLVNTLILVKFLLPAIFFLLIYSLIYKLSGENGNFSSKINGIAGALLLCPGYDFVNYKTIFKFLTGQAEPISFLIWTRPINPIIGAIIIFSFLLIVWSLRNNINKKKIIGAGVLLGVGISSYFFTGAIILAAMGIIGLIYIIQKKKNLAKALVAIFIIGLTVSLPYIYINISAAQSPFYADAAVRTGLTYGHSPIINKLIFVSLFIFLIFSIKIKTIKKIFTWPNSPDNKIQNKGLMSHKNKKNWWWFCLSLILAGIFAFNQQIITGLTVWTPHFVQYTIPLCIIALMVLFYKKIFLSNIKILKLMWIFIICIITSSSIAYGIYIQKSAYQNNFDKYKKMQNIVPIFNWLNNNTAKDSVILVVNDKHEKYAKQLMAFTNNNLYAGSFIFTLMPQERITHNYMVDLKMQGVAPKKLKQYISHNLVMHKHYFGGLTDWKNTQITKKYLRDKDIVLNLYPEFYKQNLYTELKKYRLNYILSKDKLNVSIKKQLPQLVFIKEINGFYIYELL